MTFDEIEVGAEYHSAGRTITETDIINFAGLSGDFNSLHTDDQWVRDNTDYPGRIAHGLLVHAIGEGLRCKSLDEWKILAFLETQRRMLLPVLPGDRISQTYKVAWKKPSSKQPTRGVVEVEVTIVNQRGEIVQTGHNRYMIGGCE
ncbi:MaoC/PaaZ C-terminal domain-containing protein [Aureimonas sp. SA4125]|uniref:MaoC family dehydratase n=1 Tax=Aureimonas sp. SA4125 TaxID=2826993 RepID=UPI001CC552C3|nr:MaoC/PaaZ C-terminal domain-containing protein [Aureimonas sp. SA4125]